MFITWYLRVLERELFLVDSLDWNAKAAGFPDDGFTETTWATDVNIALSEIGNESIECAGIEGDLLSRSDDLVETSPPLIDE